MKRIVLKYIYMTLFTFLTLAFTVTLVMFTFTYGFTESTFYFSLVWLAIILFYSGILFTLIRNHQDLRQRRKEYKF